MEKRIVVTDSICFIKGLKESSLVSQFYEDDKGNIWMATAEKGLLNEKPFVRTGVLQQ